MTRYDVFGVGNALTDIQAQVDDALLVDLGFSKGVMTLVDENTQARVLNSLNGQPLNRCAGGSAANTVVGVVDLGGTAAYAGKVGQDGLGSFWVADLRNLGIRVENPPGEGQSGSCVVLITPDAQRTMLTHLGISSTLGAADILESEIQQSKYVYVEGYLFTGDTTRAAAYRAIELAKKNNVKVAFTVSDPFLIHLYRDEFRRLIHGSVDLLFCNLEEARSLSHQTDPVECAKDLHKLATNVAMTLGAEGSLLMHDGKLTPIEGVPAKAIDTTGAGDMYAAGVLYGLTNGLSWHQAGHLGSQAAARVVSQLGARLKHKFTKDEMAKMRGE